jgi:hypothetical protein
MFFFWETCVSCTMLQGRISLTFRCFQSQQSRSWELLKVEKLCASTTWTLLDDTLMYYISYIFFSKFIYNVGSCWFRLQLVFSKLYGTISIIYTYINVNHCNLIVILQVISHIYHISHISLIYLLYISYISHISHIDILSPIPLRIFLNAYAACARPCWKAGALWCPEIWRLRNWHFFLRIFNVITCFNVS